jgi:hypothetical protein
MTQEQNIVYKIQVLEELVESQARTLNLDNQIISMKNRLIELAEEESRLQKREIMTLRVFLIISFVLLFIFAFLTIFTSK